MTCFILFLICLIIGGGVFAAGRLTTDPDGKAVGTIVGSILLLAAAIFFIVSIVAPVGTKKVAVLTTFGAPSGHLSNGLHFKAPWQVKHEINDAIQTDTYASEPDKDGNLVEQPLAEANCVHIRMARQSTGCANVSIRWQIREDGVDYLFRNYKDNDAITKNLLLRDLQESMNDQFGRFDPLGIDEKGNTTNAPLSGTPESYSAKVQAQLQNQIGKWIDVQSVIIPIVNYDKNTQGRVNALLQQVALTRVAEQAQKTATAQALANKALAASVSHDPGVLQSKCLDIVKEAVDSGKDLPAGFSCFGSSGNLALAVK